MSVFGTTTTGGQFGETRSTPPPEDSTCWKIEGVRGTYFQVKLYGSTNGVQNRNSDAWLYVDGEFFAECVCEPGSDPPEGCGSFPWPEITYEPGDDGSKGGIKREFEIIFKCTKLYEPCTVLDESSFGGYGGGSTSRESDKCTDSASCSFSTRTMIDAGGWTEPPTGGNQDGDFCSSEPSSMLDHPSNDCSRALLQLFLSFTPDDVEDCDLTIDCN